MLRNRGITLIELIITIVIVGIIAVAFIPSMNIFPKVSQRMRNANRNTQEASSFFLYLEQLFKNDCEILTTGNYSMTFRSGSFDYEISVPDYPAGPAPYSVYLKKDTGQPYKIGQYISLLSSPARPGLEFTYLNHRSVTAATTGDIKAVKAKITMEGSPSPFVFRSAWSVE